MEERAAEDSGSENVERAVQAMLDPIPVPITLVKRQSVPPVAQGLCSQKQVFVPRY